MEIALLNKHDTSQSDRSATSRGNTGEATPALALGSSGPVSIDRSEDTEKLLKPVIMANKYVNFEVAGTRFVSLIDPAKQWLVLRTSRDHDTLLIHTHNQDNVEELWSLEDLDQRRSEGLIDFLDQGSLCQSASITQYLSLTLGLSSKAARQLLVNLRLCYKLAEIRVRDNVDGVLASVRRSCENLLREVEAARGLLAQDSWGPEIIIASTEIPKANTLRTLYPHFLVGNLAALAPYGTRKQTLPRTSPFRHRRFCAVYYDVLKDAKRPSERTSYTKLIHIYAAIVAQITDERRLWELGFVLPEEGTPFGPRSQRQSRMLYWDEKRGICVALGVGGNLFFRPCSSLTEYAKLSDQLLRPPLLEELEHPRTKNKPYYDEVVDPSLLRVMRQRSAALAIFDYMALRKTAKNEGPVPKLIKSTFYDHIEKLPAYERSQLTMSHKQWRSFVAIRRGREQLSDIDDTWHADFGTLKLIVTTDDEPRYPIGRLMTCQVSEGLTTYALGAAIDFGGESTDLLARALRMALMSMHLKNLFAKVVGLERLVFGGTKCTILRVDHGPAFLSTFLGRVLQVLGVFPTLSQKGNPKHKSEAEELVKATGTTYETLPGATPRHLKRLRELEYDPKEDAFITISDAVVAYFQGVFNRRNHTPLPSLGNRTPHEFYKAERDLLGEDYDASPPDMLLKVFISQYYSNCYLTPAGLYLDGIPYQMPDEGEDYRRLVFRRDLLVTRNPWDLTLAYIVDVMRRKWIEIPVRPDFAELAHGMNLRQYLAAKEEAKDLARKDLEATLEEVILNLDQTRYDARNSISGRRRFANLEKIDAERLAAYRAAQSALAVAGWGPTPRWVNFFQANAPLLTSNTAEPVRSEGTNLLAGRSAYQNAAHLTSSTTASVDRLDVPSSVRSRT